MNRKHHDQAHLKQLLLQMMETELGGEQVYLAAIECALNDELKKEWTDYLAETRTHQHVMHEVCESLGVDPEEASPSRVVVRHIGESLVKAMHHGRTSGDAALAQLVACECVVHAETKDQANWELLAQVADHARGEVAQVLRDAYARVAQDEQHHLFHTKGWCRELWIEYLGMPAVLPPPEELKHVQSAIGASRAEQQRSRML